MFNVIHSRTLFPSTGPAMLDRIGTTVSVSSCLLMRYTKITDTMISGHSLEQDKRILAAANEPEPHPTMATLEKIAKYSYNGSFDVKIVDGNTLYERNDDVEAFVRSLAKEPTALEEGVEWYNLQDGLDFDSNVSKGLLTRKDSRGVVEAILERAENFAEQNWGTMSMLIGSPGIGKTRTLTYLLRQVLRAENVNVQYFDQKGECAFLFLRRNGTTHAYKAAGSPAKATGALFYKLEQADAEKIQSFILVDPNEDGAKFGHPRFAHLTVACSANEKHFHNLGKEKNAKFFYLGLPSKKEIMVMSAKLYPGLDRRELLNRINFVGPVPRYLFGDIETFEERKKTVRLKADKDMSVNEDLVVRALTYGNVLNHDPTLCGALFAHVNVETTEKDGAKVTNYRKQYITVLSQYAAWSLYLRFRSGFVRATIAGGDCDTTAVFEKLCAFDLIVGGNFKVATMTSKKPAAVKHINPAASVIKVMPNRNEMETRKFFVRRALAGETSIATDYDVSEKYECERPAKKQKLGPPFIVHSDGFPAIDFLNTNRQVFQATMGKDHDMKGWVDLLIDANILLLADKDKTLSINTRAKALEFYWVVPQHKTDWAEKDPKVPTTADIPKQYIPQKHVIDNAIKKYVQQYVIFIEQERPMQSESWSKFFPGGGDHQCIVM